MFHLNAKKCSYVDLIKVYNKNDQWFHIRDQHLVAMSVLKPHTRAMHHKFVQVHFSSLYLHEHHFTMSSV